MSMRCCSQVSGSAPQTSWVDAVLASINDLHAHHVLARGNGGPKQAHHLCLVLRVEREVSTNSLQRQRAGQGGMECPAQGPDRPRPTAGGGVEAVVQRPGDRRPGDASGALNRSIPWAGGGSGVGASVVVERANANVAREAALGKEGWEDG